MEYTAAGHSSWPVWCHHRQEHQGWVSVSDETHEIQHHPSPCKKKQKLKRKFLLEKDQQRLTRHRLTVSQWFMTNSQSEMCHTQITAAHWQSILSIYAHCHTHTHTQPFYGPFSGTTQVSLCQKRTFGLHGARRDQQRQTRWPSSWAPLHPD